MVADNLKLDECKKLAESLQEDKFKMDHTPSGHTEPEGVSCIRLLEHWNTHHGKRQSFHQLALRLKQLGKDDLANRLAMSVTDEKVAEVQENFLKDPFKSKIHTNSPLLQESRHVERPPVLVVPDTKWTTLDVLEMVVLILISILLVLFGCLTIIRFFLPDSFARIRASLYVSWLGRRPGQEEVFYIM
ncbi:uncharacterized protein LOC118186973 [Stegodyphus dumicola]|uniref:uncharacterized protein LOC118186973 n=1 Tax=Stegodyphus dumicola TaxID=202533 RepID=UPI0015A864AA|nr:uncharacterized protein LOC118186973 [Stegodyphus dumicola]